MFSKFKTFLKHPSKTVLPLILKVIYSCAALAEVFRLGRELVSPTFTKILIVTRAYCGFFSKDLYFNWKKQCLSSKQLFH